MSSAAPPPFAPAEPRAPTLEARGARITVDAAVAIEALDYVSQGDRVVLYGDVSPLIAAISGLSLTPPDPDDPEDESGEARVSAGTLLVGGATVEDGKHYATVGVAPLDPPMPLTWSAEEYVTWSLRLSGLSKSGARELAHAALGPVGLGRAAGRKIALLARPERRALLLAHAVARDPRALVLEEPLADLEGGAAAFVGAALGAITDGRQTVLSVRRIDTASAEGALVRSATDLVIVMGGQLVVGESPARVLAGGRLYGVTVRSNADGLRAQLAASGIELVGGPLRFSVALPDGATTSDIIGAAHRARAAVVELVPLV
jgi:ABC-2 type transport system ATP-binding protein